MPAWETVDINGEISVWKRILLLTFIVMTSSCTWVQYIKILILVCVCVCCAVRTHTPPFLFLWWICTYVELCWYFWITRTGILLSAEKFSKAGLAVYRWAFGLLWESVWFVYGEFISTCLWSFFSIQIVSLIFAHLLFFRPDPHFHSHSHSPPPLSPIFHTYPLPHLSHGW